MARRIKDSWIREYLRYTENTESPSMFHLWVGISTIASVIDRDVYVNQGFFKIYPNLYIILVAGSQECRKSTAISIGESLLRNLPNPPNIVSQKMTPESFIEAIQPYSRIGESGIVSMKSTATILAHELSVLIDRDAAKNGFIALLVDLYDCKEDGVPWEYRTKKRGVEEIYNNCINLLGASSPEYLRISLPPDEIGGGFTARTILVYQDKPEKRIAFPIYTEKEAKMKENLIYDLDEISKIKGEFQWLAESRKWYENWYMTRDTSNVPDGLAPYYVKKAEHLLSVAMILSIAESDDLVLTPIHLEAALATLEENEILMPYAMEGLIPTYIGQLNNKVLQVILRLTRDKGVADRSTLLKRLWRDMDSETLTNSLDTLIQAGLITESREKGGRTIYVPTSPEIR